MYPRTSLEFRPRNVFIFTILAISCLQIANAQLISLIIYYWYFDCPRLIMRVAKGIIRVYGGCSKDFLISMEQNLKEYQRRVDCVMRCTMERIGLLNEFNKVTNDTVQVFFDKFLPEDYHEIGHIFVEGCTDEYGNDTVPNQIKERFLFLSAGDNLSLNEIALAPLMDNEDDTCTAFGDFVRCVQSVIAEAC